jgi:hypothetical protein
MDARKKHEKALRRKQKLAARANDPNHAPKSDTPAARPPGTSPQNQPGMNAARNQVSTSDRPGSMFRRKV